MMKWLQLIYKDKFVDKMKKALLIALLAGIGALMFSRKKGGITFVDSDYQTLDPE